MGILCVALALALTAYTTLPQWACFGVVGVVLLVAGGCFIALVSRKNKFDLIPQRAVEGCEGGYWMDQVNDQDIERNLQDREQTHKGINAKVGDAGDPHADNIEKVKQSVRNSTDLKYQVSQRPGNVRLGGSAGKCGWPHTYGRPSISHCAFAPPSPGQYP